MGTFKLRSVVSLPFNSGRVGLIVPKESRSLLSCVPVSARCGRGAHAQALTDNIRYITNHADKLQLDPTTMRLDKQSKKPLCIMLSWFLARPDHVMKYATLYLKQGYDVISVSCKPWQFLWPTLGAQLIAADLLRFIHANDHTPVVVHGFSGGAHVWAQLLVHAANNKDKYHAVLDRVFAQVWDSPADTDMIPEAFASVVLPTNKVLQALLNNYIKLHLKIFRDITIKPYEKATEMFYASPCRAPALFLLSKIDPMSDAEKTRKIRDHWVKLGVQCSWKCWMDTPHVQHYRYHPEEYVAALHEHLHALGLVGHAGNAKII